MARVCPKTVPVSTNMDTDMTESSDRKMIKEDPKMTPKLVHKTMINMDANMMNRKKYTIHNTKLPKDWTLDDRELADLELLLNGGFDPLTGYLCEDDYYSVLEKMRLTTGEVWPMPIVLSIPCSTTVSNTHWIGDTNMDTTTTTTTSTTGTPKMENMTKMMDEKMMTDMKETTMSEEKMSEEVQVLLRDSVGTIVGKLHVEDIFKPDLTLEMEKVLGTTDDNHPYVDYMKKKFTDSFYIGGRVESCNPICHFDFMEHRQSPEEIKKFIKDNNWNTVVGFQTRNPMHCSHFQLTLQALEEVSRDTQTDAKLLLTPAVGPTQIGDIEYHIRVRCYKAVIPHYPKDSIHMTLLPLAMRMAGPREAVWHAIIRRNYGCTHFIVGRDHAGPSVKTKLNQPFYGQYDAHTLLQSVQDEIGIKPVFGKAMVYVGEEFGGYAQETAVPEMAEPQNISGTELRRRLQTREDIPEWYSFPTVIEELHKFYLPLNQRGLCVYFTGLPCSGKTTLAMAIEAALLENSVERRRITVLDADIIRTHLSKGLGFSHEDRSANVRRIGFVASEIVKHGGICVCANIAPYEADRTFNRNLIVKEGGNYVEVYVSTPLNICEKRDVKELYKKARSGQLKHFTGISDPYQEPISPEIVIDSSSDIHGKVKIIFQYLLKNQFITNI